MYDTWFQIRSREILQSLKIKDIFIGSFDVFFKAQFHRRISTQPRKGGICYEPIKILVIGLRANLRVE